MDIKVISTNIRFENKADEINNRPNRKKIWAKTILDQDPDFICTQEGRRPQLEDAEKSLEDFHLAFKERSWIEERMYPCIFVNHSWEVLNAGDKWLSLTPDIPGSLSFESMFPRLMTFAHLKNKKNSKEILIVNCHLDHMKSSTRDEQSKVLVSEVNKLKKKTSLLSSPEILTSPLLSAVRKNIDHSSISLKDPWIKLNKKEEGTHHKFTGDNSSTKRIDWILASENLIATEAKILKNSENNIYPSDHFPIFSKFTLN